MFSKEFGQEILVFEYSICIPEHNFYRSAKCGMSGVIRFWQCEPVQYALTVRLSIYLHLPMWFHLRYKKLWIKKIRAILSTIHMACSNDWTYVESVWCCNRGRWWLFLWYAQKEYFHRFCCLVAGYVDRIS
jgi:hypothetical protein